MFFRTHRWGALSVDHRAAGLWKWPGVSSREPGLQSQEQPIRSIGEVIETGGFARKSEDGRNGEGRLANRCVHASSAAGCEIGERCHTSSALAEEDRVK